MRSLEGRTALVTGGGAPFGRAVALALSARGVRIVVTGRDEKALGETVGEIVHGGGKARHVAGEGRASSVLGTAVERAKEVFGALDIVIDTELTDVDYTFEATVPHVGSPGRLLLVTAARSPERSQEAMALVVRERARALLPGGTTCNAIVVANLAAGDDGDDVAADVGELAVFLCSRAADRITGQSIAVEAGT
jgi:NAD(P)-dependent dehydrogenase (short-subunit alcohol dehydrogenase family)